MITHGEYLCQIDEQSCIFSAHYPTDKALNELLHATMITLATGNAHDVMLSQFTAGLGLGYSEWLQGLSERSKAARDEG